MIQNTWNGVTWLANVRLNLYDKMTTDEYGILITFTSQLTGKSKTFMPVSALFSKKDRYVQFNYLITISDNLSGGLIQLGTTDYPLGFYDVTIYENESGANLDPSGLSVIYTGLMNLSSASNTRSVTYTEYTTNDSDTESVYITI